MKSLKLTKLLLLSLLSVFIWSCNEDDDDPTNPSGPSDQGMSQVDISTLLDGDINVTVNPSSIAPLTAELAFKTVGQTQVEIQILGEVAVSNKFEYTSSNHTVAVLGLYGNRLNTVVLKVSNNLIFAYDTIRIQTDSLPSYLPKITINQANPSMMEEGMNLNCLSITNGTRFEAFPVIYDRNGDIRWFLDLSGQHPNAGFVSPWEPVENGRLLTEVGDYIIEYDMLGREAVKILIPPDHSSHHDVVKLDNGNYAIATTKKNSQIMWEGQMRNTVEDFFIEIDASGNLVQEWDLRQNLDVYRQDLLPSLSFGLVDWFHQNALIYDKSDDTYILSGRNQGIVKVDRQNKVKWILAPHKGWGRAGIGANGPELDSLLLTAVNSSGTPYDTSVQNGNALDAGFDWPWGQHAPVLLPNGNLALFDNGVNRTFSNPTPNTPNYSRYVEYQIDETNMTVQQVRDYGTTRSTETFSWIVSDVDYLPNTGNVLFCPGVSDGFTTSRIVELTRPGMTPVFEGVLTYENERAPGGGPAFGLFDITYRAERVKLYRD